jgi:hypothetical protein
LLPPPTAAICNLFCNPTLAPSKPTNPLYGFNAGLGRGMRLRQPTRQMDAVCDPFGGSFASACAVKLLGRRRYVGCDIVPACITVGGGGTDHGNGLYRAEATDGRRAAPSKTSSRNRSHVRHGAFGSKLCGRQKADAHLTADPQHGNSRPRLRATSRTSGMHRPEHPMGDGFEKPACSPPGGINT